MNLMAVTWSTYLPRNQYGIGNIIPFFYESANSVRNSQAVLKYKTDANNKEVVRLDVLYVLTFTPY